MTFPFVKLLHTFSQTLGALYDGLHSLLWRKLYCLSTYYRATLYHTAVYAVARCLSVRLSQVRQAYHNANNAVR